MRRFYRLVTQKDPPDRDFFSLIAMGHRPYVDADLQRRAEEVSVWDNVDAALDLARRKRSHRFVAVLEIPEDVRLTAGKRGHWGIPKSAGPTRIREWVVEVRDVPLSRGETNRGWTKGAD